MVNPAIGLALIAGWVSLSLLLVQKIQLKDPEAKKAKERIQELQKKVQEMHKKGKLEDGVMDEMLKHQGVLMKKVMLPSMAANVLSLFVLKHVSIAYAGFVISLPFLIPVPALALPPLVLKDTLGWLGWYVLCSLGWNLSLRQLLGIKI